MDQTNEAYMPDDVKKGEFHEMEEKGGGAVYDGQANGYGRKVGYADQEGVAEKEQRLRDRPALWNCRLIASYPITCFLIGLFLHLASVFAMFILLVPGYDILSLDTGSVYVDARSSKEYLRSLAWEERDDDDNIIQRITRQVERTEVMEGMEYQFECDDCNIFTKTNMMSMAEAEQKLVSSSKFTDKHCLRVYNPLLDYYICAPTNSVLRLFDGSLTLHPQGDLRLVDPTYDRIPEILDIAYNEVPLTRGMLEYFLPPKRFTITNETAETKLIRGQVGFGYPLAGYQSESDRYKKQEDIVEDYLKDDYEKIPEKIHDKDADKLSFYYFSSTLFYEFFDYIILQDTYYLIGSFLFIVIIIFLQTWSFFITFFTSLSLATSLCITNLIYRFIFDFKYFGNIHFLVIFVVLGVGCDDIFIFTNAWKQTGSHTYGSFAQRLSDCFRRTALPMLFTTLTTILAFAVSVASELLTISTLAVFGGLYILVIYCSAIVFFPAVIAVHHVYFEKFSFSCCCPSKYWNPETVDYDVKPEPNFLVRFLKGPYASFVTNGIAAGVIILIFAGIMAAFIYFATTLEIDIDLVTQNPFRRTKGYRNNYGEFFHRRLEKYDDEGPVRVFLVWGLKEQDLDDCHHTDPKCNGDTVYDDDFNLNTPENQRALLTLCQDLRSLSSKEIKDLHIKTGSDGLPEIDCFLDEMQNHLTIEEPDRVVCDPPLSPTLRPRYPPPAPNFSLPVDASDAVTIMQSTMYPFTEPLAADYENWFEIVMSHWLYGGWPTTNALPAPPCVWQLSMTAPAQLGMPDQFWTYNKMLGEARTRHTVVKDDLVPTGLLDFTYEYGTRLKYVAIAVSTTLDGFKLRYDKGIPIMNDWEDYLDKQMKVMPKDLKNGFQITPSNSAFPFNMWNILISQQALMTSAYWGVGSGLVIAFVLLLVGTLNVLTAVVTTLLIACNVVVYIGFLPWYDSKMDVFESVVLTLIVGVSADYSIHMALAYSRSEHVTRKERVRDALHDIGLSISSGVLTTLGACMFMFFTTLKFFPQFGGILFVIMSSAYVFSIVVLPAILGLIGPQGDFLSLKPLFRACCCCRK